MNIEESLKIFSWFRSIEEQASNIIQFIPYKEINYKTEIPSVAPIICEAGSLINTIHKYNKSGEKIFNYYLDGFSIDKALLILIKFPPDIMRPFVNIIQGNEFREPTWWDAYNSLKHDRINETDKSNLFNMINIIGALFLIITQDYNFIDALIIEEVYIGTFANDYIKKFKEKIYKDEFHKDRKNVAFESKLFYSELGSKDIDEIDPLNYRNHLVKTKKLHRYMKSSYL